MSCHDVTTTTFQILNCAKYCAKQSPSAGLNSHSGQALSVVVAQREHVQSLMRHRSPQPRLQPLQTVERSLRFTWSSRTHQQNANQLLHSFEQAAHFRVHTLVDLYFLWNNASWTPRSATASSGYLLHSARSLSSSLPLHKGPLHSVSIHQSPSFSSFQRPWNDRTNLCAAESCTKSESSPEPVKCFPVEVSYQQRSSSWDRYNRVNRSHYRFVSRLQIWQIFMLVSRFHSLQILLWHRSNLFPRLFLLQAVQLFCLLLLKAIVAYKCIDLIQTNKNSSGQTLQTLDDRLLAFFLDAKLHPLIILNTL